MAGGADVLAGEPRGQDVDRLDAAPVDLGDVAQVRHGRPVAGQYGARCRVGFAVPGDRGAREQAQSGQVQAAHTTEQRSDPQAGGGIERYRPSHAGQHRFVQRVVERSKYRNNARSLEGITSSGTLFADMHQSRRQAKGLYEGHMQLSHAPMWQIPLPSSAFRTDDREYRVLPDRRRLRALAHRADPPAASGRASGGRSRRLRLHGPLPVSTSARLQLRQQIIEALSTAGFKFTGHTRIGNSAKAFHVYTAHAADHQA